MCVSLLGLSLGQLQHWVVSRFGVKGWFQGLRFQAKGVRLRV